MLSAKQKRFCEEYLIDLNCTQAAIRAGYSPKTAYAIGEENLKKPDVWKTVRQMMDERSARTEITADQVLRELWSIANDDIKNYLTFKPIVVATTQDADGKLVEHHAIDVAIKDSTKINTRNIAEVSVGKDGQFKFKLYCRDTALVNVGKHLGMFKDKLEITTHEEVDVSKLTPEEQLEYLKLCKKARA